MPDRKGERLDEEFLIFFIKLCQQRKGIQCSETPEQEQDGKKYHEKGKDAGSGMVAHGYVQQEKRTHSGQGDAEKNPLFKILPIPFQNGLPASKNFWNGEGNRTRHKFKKEEYITMKKKFLAMTLAAVMAASLAACGGDGGGSSNGGSRSGNVSITIFNSKSEVQSQFEEMAQEYSEKTGVDVEVYYSSDTVAAHMASRYSANDPYTLAMVDAKDIYSLATEHAADLSDQDWVEKTNHAIKVNDKVVGFPVCIEARGMIYNADAIKNVTGKDFNPDDYATADAFEALCEELVAGGMEAPTGIMKEDWFLGAHFLSEVYEEQPDVESFVQSLYSGSADLANNEKWNAKMDLFDVLMKYNYAAGSPIAAEREMTEQKLAEGYWSSTTPVEH